MIIYVEDNKNNQLLLTRMLKLRNIDVKCYETIEDGYEAVMKLKPDIILVDMHLKSRRNGLDLVRQLRAAGVQTPIIIVTVFNMLADRKRALQEGCNDYLSKPYQVADLYEILDRYLPATNGEETAATS